jgi:hypothetical protein
MNKNPPNRKKYPDICTGYGYKKVNDDFLQDSAITGIFRKHKVTDIIFPNLTGINENKTINYLDTNKFLIHLNKIILGENQSVCSNNHFLTVDMSTLKYSYTNEFYQKIKDALSSTDIRVFIPIYLKFSNGGHSNLIVIEKPKEYTADFNFTSDSDSDSDSESEYEYENIINNGTIYFFEPHGSKYGDEISKYINISEHIRTIIINTFNLRHHYDYINVFQDGNEKGPQTLQIYSKNFITDGGFCLSWTLLFINLLLLNKNIDIITIKEFLTRFTADKLNCYIQRYTTKVTNDSIETQCVYKFNDNSFDINLTNKEKQTIKKLITDTFENRQLSSLNTMLIFRNFPFYNEIVNKIFQKHNSDNIIKQNVYLYFNNFKHNLQNNFYKHYYPLYQTIVNKTFYDLIMQNVEKNITNYISGYRIDEQIKQLCTPYYSESYKIDSIFNIAVMNYIDKYVKNNTDVLYDILYNNITSWPVRYYNCSYLSFAFGTCNSVNQLLTTDEYDNNVKYILKKYQAHF